MKNIDNVSQPKEYGHLTSQFNLDGVDTASSMKLWITVVLPQNIGPYKHQNLSDHSIQSVLKDLLIKYQMIEEQV